MMHGPLFHLMSEASTLRLEYTRLICLMHFESRCTIFSYQSHDFSRFELDGSPAPQFHNCIQLLSSSLCQILKNIYGATTFLFLFFHGFPQLVGIGLHSVRFQTIMFTKYDLMHCGPISLLPLWARLELGVFASDFALY
jgi:hypothetical protein